MITTAFIAVLIGIVFALVSPVLLLPDVSLDSGLGSAVANVADYIALADQIVPMLTLVAIVSFFVVFEGGYAIYKAVKWVYNKIPGVN